MTTTTIRHTSARLGRLGIVLALPALLGAADGTIDLSPITQFIGSIMGALSGWFPWVLFCGFLLSLIGAAFHSRRRMEWVGGMALTVVLALAYIVGKAYITKMTGTNLGV